MFIKYYLFSANIYYGITFMNIVGFLSLQICVVVFSNRLREAGSDLCHETLQIQQLNFIPGRINF